MIEENAGWEFGAIKKGCSTIKYSYPRGQDRSIGVICNRGDRGIMGLEGLLEAQLGLDFVPGYDLKARGVIKLQ